jgi:translation initiation factor RLI1
MAAASESLSHVVLVAAGRTTTYTSPDIQVSARSLSVHVNTTAIGSGNITATINGKDVGSGTYYLLLAGAAISSNTFNRYKVSPHLTAAANSIATDLVPDVVQVVITANNANAATYTVTLVEHV